MNDSQPYVSIVIRCRNEGHTLAEVLEALSHQDCSFSWEVLLVDNDSTDNTTEVAAKYGARSITISRQEFSYGRAINRGIEAARGELVLLLSAHSLPLSSQFLENAASCFSDPRMAAVRCLMVGNESQLRRWYAPKDIEYQSVEEQNRAEKGESWLALYPTAGCCMLRRSIALEIKFDEHLSSNEDKYWASCVLAAGYRIRCCAESPWMYLRKRTPRQTRLALVRQELSLFRINGYVRHNWKSYVASVLRTLVSVPFAAIRKGVDSIIRDTNSLMIPRTARKEPKVGSYTDFEPNETGTKAVSAERLAAAASNTPNERVSSRSTSDMESSK